MFQESQPTINDCLVSNEQVAVTASVDSKMMSKYKNFIAASGTNAANVATIDSNSTDKIDELLEKEKQNMSSEPWNKLDKRLKIQKLHAYAEKYGPMGVIHFEAHSDLWQDDDYTRIDHGTMMYKAVKSGLVDPKRSVQIGIRTHTDDYLGVSVIDAREVHEKGAAAAVARARAIVGDGPTYLTFDIDALDPAFAPGTGTPVWGGLASWQAAAMLRDLAGINMVGGDIVEVSPPYDTTGATAIAGAHVAYDLIALFAWAKARRG
jgi:hypothetical protein